MSDPTKSELNESIELLSAYSDRLKKEVTSIAQKLQLPPNRLKAILEEHSELKSIKELLVKLTKQRDLQV